MYSGRTSDSALSDTYCIFGVRRNLHADGAPVSRWAKKQRVFCRSGVGAGWVAAVAPDDYAG